MEAGGLTDVNPGTAGGYAFVSRPNRSLSPRQQGLMFWSVAIPCLGIASIFAGLGYWLMLPFAGLEVGLLAWAFESLRTHDQDYESIAIQGDRLILEWREAGHTRRRELNTHWTQAQCVCEKNNNNCRFCVSAHGEAIELGRYLNDQGRIKLAQAVGANLSR